MTSGMSAVLDAAQIGFGLIVAPVAFVAAMVVWFKEAPEIVRSPAGRFLFAVVVCLLFGDLPDVPEGDPTTGQSVAVLMSLLVGAWMAWWVWRVAVRGERPF